MRQRESASSAPELLEAQSKGATWFHPGPGGTEPCSWRAEAQGSQAPGWPWSGVEIPSWGRPFASKASPWPERPSRILISLGYSTFQAFHSKCRLPCQARAVPGNRNRVGGPVHERFASIPSPMDAAGANFVCICGKPLSSRMAPPPADHPSMMNSAWQLPGCWAELIRAQKAGSRAARNLSAGPFGLPAPAGIALAKGTAAARRHRLGGTTQSAL